MKTNETKRAIKAEATKNFTSVYAVMREIQTVYINVMSRDELREYLNSREYELEYFNEGDKKLERRHIEDVKHLAKRAMRLDVSEEAREAVREAINKGITMRDFCLDTLLFLLEGTDYVCDGKIMEQYKDKESDKRLWRPIEKWTIAKAVNLVFKANYINSK